eukprot:1160486-Pelagomonas_calceolata.AAC.3
MRRYKVPSFVPDGNLLAPHLIPGDMPAVHIFDGASEGGHVIRAGPVSGATNILLSAIGSVCPTGRKAVDGAPAVSLFGAIK